MNTILRRAILPGLLVWSSMFIVGCFDAQLEVAPAAVAFDADQSERRLTLSNLGDYAFDWTLDEMARVSPEAAWEATEIDWLAADKTSGTLKPGLEHLTLTVNRTQLLPGSYTNYAVRVQARGVERIVPISLVVTPLLGVDPGVVQLTQDDRTALFTVINRSETALTWSARYFEGNDPSVEAVELPPDMILEPDGGALARQGSTLVRVTWTVYRSDFGLRLSSPEAPGHDAVVLFRFERPITDLQVSPEELTVYFSRPPQGSSGVIVTQPASELGLANVGSQSMNWSISVQPIGAAVGQDAAVIAVEPATGTLAAGETGTVEVRVADPAAAIPGTGNYELLVRLAGQDGIIFVPLRLEAVVLPVVIASEPPNPNVDRPEYSTISTLDFGQIDVQREFYVVNIGPLGSDLFFKIFHDDQDSEPPIIVDVTPLSGDTNTEPGSVFFIPGTNDMVDAERVVVTVDRSAMVEDVEYRNLYIEAWNQEGTERITGVEPWKLEIRVERPPMKVEGALNRSRPPFLMRFVFLLRDTVGRVIPTRTAEDLAKLRFEVTEDGLPLDLDEVAMQVNGPESLKANIVLMLDYTGSMYNAGTDAVENPRAPGEVLDEVRNAAAQFLDDLPASWRVALMYHNDRQPLNRLIHPFSTDRESLKTALYNFSVPADQHGTSDVWNALTDAMERIVAEDAQDTLPFDEADVRGVLFVTDGVDNSSTGQADDIVTYARDNRVCLYPLVYNVGSPINYDDVITLADESGGHFYNAGNPENLVTMLGHRSSLVLTPVSRGTSDPDNMIAFKVANAGKTTLSWTIVPEENYSWLEPTVPISGSTVPGGESLVSVTVAPEYLNTPLREGRAVLVINSTDGEGSAVVSLSVADDGVTINRLAVDLYDTPGDIWNDLRNQVVLSYVTPLQREAQYNIHVYYTQPDDSEISGFFEEDSVFYMGDVRAGQISMLTSGICVDNAAATLEEVATAEVYVRADYVPRGVNTFKLRLMPQVGADMPAEVVDAFWQHEMNVELAPEGLLVFPGGEKPDWRLVPGNDGVYTLLTPEAYTLPYASFGNLLRVTFTNLAPFLDVAAAAGMEPEFFLDMRVDNSMYYEPGTQYHPSRTVYFLYPSGPMNPDRPLRITSEDSDLAAPGRTVMGIAYPGIDPEAPGVWDRDADGVPDFNDPYPDNEDLPGKMIRPQMIRFELSGTEIQELDVTLVNSRWDTFRVENIALEVPSLSSLDPAQFSWYLSDGLGGWTATDAASLVGTSLAPGESLALRLEFNSLGLPSGTYTATLRLTTDLFEDETTSLEVRIS